LADRSSSTDSSSGSGPQGGPGDRPLGEKPPAGKAPGLGEQFGRTKSAFLGLIASHIDLAKAEFAEIGGEIKRAAALGGAALMLLFLAGVTIVVGLLLFLGETLFGSIGWGVLDGAELLLAATALLIFAIIDLSWGRAFSAFIVALCVGLVVGGLLAVDWPWLSHHYSGMPAPIVLAVVAGVVLIGVLGTVLGSAFGRGPATAGLALGVICGALLGLLASGGPGLRVASAMGVAALLLFWPIVAAVFVFRHGIDMAKLRARFVPEQTIATTKETIEWVREQLPLARKS
jgi:hypothetical protein